MQLQVVLDPSDEGGFTALVPSLPGYISEGETREEVLRNIQEAIALYSLRVNTLPLATYKEKNPEYLAACGGGLYWF